MFVADSLAGLAMIPFAAAFRARGLRVNEYGRKTLELLFGEVGPPLDVLLAFAQHLVISWLAAVPLLVFFSRGRAWAGDRRARMLLGAAYGAGFYVVLNSFALPVAFGDPTPWALGLETVYPSLTIHVVYGAVLGAMARARPAAAASESRAAD